MLGFRIRLLHTGFGLKLRFWGRDLWGTFRDFLVACFASCCFWERAGRLGSLAAFRGLFEGFSCGLGFVRVFEQIRCGGPRYSLNPKCLRAQTLNLKPAKALMPETPNSPNPKPQTPECPLTLNPKPLHHPLPQTLRTRLGAHLKSAPEPAQGYVPERHALSGLGVRGFGV